MYTVGTRGGGEDKGFYSQINDRGAHPIGNSPITSEPGGSARVRKTYSPIGEAFNLDHTLRLASEGGHVTSRHKILEFSTKKNEVESLGY